MCQYYRWNCAQCCAINDVVVRCYAGHQSQHPCPRNAEPLSLPGDAPKLECQQCFAPRPPPPVRTDVNLNASFRSMSIHTPAIAPGALHMPPEQDVFWLNPSLRLPDHEGKLGEYKRKRHEVFDSAEDSEKGRKMDEGVGNTAWEEAWLQLKEALQKP